MFAYKEVEDQMIQVITVSCSWGQGIMEEGKRARVELGSRGKLWWSTHTHTWYIHEWQSRGELLLLWPIVPLDDKIRWRLDLRYEDGKGRKTAMSWIGILGSSHNWTTKWLCWLIIDHTALALLSWWPWEPNHMFSLCQQDKGLTLAGGCLMTVTCATQSF